MVNRNKLYKWLTGISYTLGKFKAAKCKQLSYMADHLGDIQKKQVIF